MHVYPSAHVPSHTCPPPTSSNIHTWKWGENPYWSRVVPQCNTIGVTPSEVQGRAGRRPWGWSRAWCRVNIHHKSGKGKKMFFSSVFGGSVTLLTTDQTSGIQDGETTLCDVRPPHEVFCHRGPRMCNAFFLCSKQSCGSSGVRGLSRLPLVPA